MKALQRAEMHFLSGVDVENLRALCHQFQQSLACVKTIQAACPHWKHQAMDEALRPYVAVFNMCTHRRFIEQYAMVQNCLYSQRAATGTCYRQFAMSASSYEHHARQDHRSALRIYCQYLSQLEACVTGNVRPWCGDRATQLTSMLVNVSVDLSYKCAGRHQHHHRHAASVTTKPSKSSHRSESQSNSLSRTKTESSSAVRAQPLSSQSFGVFVVFVATSAAAKLL